MAPSYHIKYIGRSADTCSFLTHLDTLKILWYFGKEKSFFTKWRRKSWLTGGLAKIADAELTLTNLTNLTKFKSKNFIKKMLNWNKEARLITLLLQNLKKNFIFLTKLSHGCRISSHSKKAWFGRQLRRLHWLESRLKVWQFVVNSSELVKKGYFAWFYLVFNLKIKKVKIPHPQCG